MRVAVIGGGPSGIVTLKYLTTAHDYFPGMEPIKAKLFEAEDSIGGTFKYRDYEDAELVSSRQLTTFSDYRYPATSPDFLSTKEYVAYLAGYAKQFNLTSHISLSTSVTKVERVDGGEHIVHSVNDGEVSEWFCDAIAICSGLHVSPNIPKIPGLQNVPNAIHSSQFKERIQFGKDKDVMIVGSGETGMDIAYLAVTADTNSVTLCHRDGFFSPSPSWFGATPSETPQGNIPYDVNAASLFDTAYQHHILRDSFLPWWYYDRFAKYTTWLVSGTKAGLDQWIGEISSKRFHASKIFFNKSTKPMPYISEQYRRTTSLFNTLRSYVAQVPFTNTHGRKIELPPWPESISEKGDVTFVENKREEARSLKDRGFVCKPDLVIMATGYTQSFPVLDKSYPIPAQADMRSVWKTGDESVGFIGFVRPSFGSRINYGVDHESYAYQIACDIGFAPSITSLVNFKSPKLHASWALSANVNTKFRLVGPWKWNGAQEVMEGEIWATITRR